MRILVADDDVVLQTLLRGLLPVWGYEPIPARTGEQAWSILRQEGAPRLAIVDWIMPGMDGVQLCRRVRSAPRMEYTYIILLTSRSDTESAVEALDAGADDFIVKPFHALELRARLNPARRILDLEQELARRANFDLLTGLPNRTLLEDRFALAAEQAKRNASGLALLYLDLDGFKRVNDTLGHLAGDRLLQEIASRLKSGIRQSDTLARIGGDEFVLLAPGLESPMAIAEFTDKLSFMAAQPVDLDGEEAHVTASIGASAFPRDGADLETLLRAADLAMYRQKRIRREYAALHLV